MLCHAHQLFGVQWHRDLRLIRRNDSGKLADLALLIKKTVLIVFTGQFSTVGIIAPTPTKNTDVTKPRNTGTPKHRNSYFFQHFFLNTETHKETNSADIGSVEKFVASAKRVGLQTWMSRCAIDSLNKQSGWKLSISLVQEYIQTKVSYSYCCILSEKRRNLTQIKIQTFADAKLFEFVKKPTGWECSFTPHSIL